MQNLREGERDSTEGGSVVSVTRVARVDTSLIPVLYLTDLDYFQLIRATSVLAGFLFQSRT